MGPPPTESGTIDVSLYQAPRRIWERGRGLREARDWLVTEEPLEIRLCGLPIAVVMRTPGHDVELGAGFAITEHLLDHPNDLERVAHCSWGEEPDNVLLITPRPGREPRATNFQRRLYATSSCGICGKRSIAQATKEAPPLNTTFSLKASVLAGLPERLRSQQPLFESTGGLHAAGLFDADGSLLVVREDVGRHNAVDKCVGWALLRAPEQPLNACGIVVSGRISYEVVQKALAARVPVVVGVGAVSSLAARLAQRANMTLVGFTNAERFCVYAGEDRIT